MKRSLILLAVAALLVGCEDGYSVRAQELSTKPTVWHGKPGTAVTIRFPAGTERLNGAVCVAFKFRVWELFQDGNVNPISGLSVPVMKLGPRSITLFFNNEDDVELLELKYLPEEIEAGRLELIPRTEEDVRADEEDIRALTGGVHSHRNKIEDKKGSPVGASLPSGIYETLRTYPKKGRRLIWSQSVPMLRAAFQKKF